MLQLCAKTCGLKPSPMRLASQPTPVSSTSEPANSYRHCRATVGLTRSLGTTFLQSTPAGFCHDAFANRPGHVSVERLIALGRVLVALRSPTAAAVKAGLQNTPQMLLTLLLGLSAPANYDRQKNKVCPRGRAKACGRARGGAADV